MSTPKAKRQEAAQKAAMLRAQAEKQRKRSIILAVSFLSVAVLALIGVVIYILSQSGGSDLSSAEGSDQPPSVVNEDGAVTIGSSGELGSVNEGAPVVSVYYDYLCPACGLFESTNSADLEQLAADGVITLAYHPVSILDGAAAGSKYSTWSANAAATVMALAPEKFIDFHNALYANQPQENTQIDSKSFLIGVANKAGVPADVSSRFEEGLFTQWVADTTDAATADGLMGTPTIRVDGKDLDQSVNWAEPGALRAYLESL